MAVAGTRAAMCDPAQGWENFELNGGSVPKNERARSVLNRSVAHVITELQDDNKLPASCQLGRIYVVKDCMKSHIVKNVVQYGIYDSMERLLFICKNNARVWYQVHTRTRVNRRGNILNVAYTAKRIAV
ncbi:hypothetical protein ABPG77_011516 [Micractinium sp. CCAP 211/92]